MVNGISLRTHSRAKLETEVPRVRLTIILIGDFPFLHTAKIASAGTTDEEGDLVRVATFNINNINKRLNNLLVWLAKAEPDVVSLQELKAEQKAFPVDALRNVGYEAVW